MNKNLVIALALLGATSAAPALRAQATSTPQQPQQPPTVASVLNGVFGAVEQQVVSAAEAMPEEKYGFAPTNGEFKGVRTFPAELKTKAEIVQYLKDSFALGHRALSTITAENEVTPLAKPVLPFLSTRLAIANIATFHPMDHYGQMVEYLRMNGIIPPASRPRPPQQQAPASQPKSQR